MPALAAGLYLLRTHEPPEQRISQSKEAVVGGILLPLLLWLHLAPRQLSKAKAAREWLRDLAPFDSAGADSDRNTIMVDT